MPIYTPSCWHRPHTKSSGLALGCCMCFLSSSPSLISSSSLAFNNPSKLLCPSCPKKFLSEKTLGTHIRKLNFSHLPELLSTTDHSKDFFFDLIGDSFFYFSTLDSANLDNSVPNPSSWLTNLEDFVISNKNKFNIFHLNINSVVGLEKR